VLLTIPAALLLGNLIAAFPARAAARTKPAMVLRTE
jgi:ABC-type lipoprotein release transport system permease subunit